MFVTDKFVYLHFPRTGGTFAKRLLMEAFPSGEHFDQFLPANKLPSRFDGIERIGFVRNPWEWFVSWAGYSDELRSFSKFLYVCGDHYMRYYDTIFAGEVTLHNFNEMPKIMSVLTGIDCIKERPDNYSDHDHYSKYYTQPLIDLVEKNCRAVIEKHGFVFDKQHL